MTTFHDQQPQSRRAVRQSERADEDQAGFTEAPGSAPQQYSAPARDMWDTTSRRAAQLPPVSSLSEEATPGRRSATPPPALPEPLHYSTQSRPVAPSNDGPSFRSRGSAAPQPVAFDPSASAREAVRAPESDQPAFRVRDFSPEARSAAADTRWSEPNPAPTIPVAPASDLDYHTEARFRAAAAAAPLAPISEVPASVAPINKLWAPPEPSPAPAAAAPASSDYPIEQTLTRRELRAMQQAEEAAGLRSQQPATPAATLQSQQPAAPAATLQSQQPVTPAVLLSQQPAAPAQAPAAQAPATQAPTTQQPAAVFPLVEPRVGPPPVMPPTAAPASPTFTPAAPVSSSPFDSLFSAPSAPAQPEPVAEVPAEIAPAPAAEPSVWTPPTGHWSTQMDVDDDIETTISRRIGSGSTTTSALVLPSIPNGTDIRGPLTGTGEIMLTGSIELPHSLSSTGQSDRFDNGGIDELFDLSDSEVISTDSSPVRAIRAVSTHTSGHGVTHTQKPKGTRALTALLIAASSMAVVVAGLLVAAFAFNVF